MKVLQLSSEKSWRGGEQQIAYLIEYLRKNNVEVVVCARTDSAFAGWCEKKNIACYSLPFRNGFDLKTALKIKSIASAEQVTLINAHSGKSHSLAWLALKLGMKIPLIVHRRVDFPLKSAGPSLRKYNHPRVRAIVCVSNAIAHLVRDAVDHPERVHTVYSGIDPGRFNQNPATGYIHRLFSIPSHRKLIANISAIAPHKDYETFLATASEVVAHRDDCHFLIVGDGPLFQKIRAQSTRMQLDGFVTMTGFREDIPGLFRELTLFLITSDTEGLGTTVIDALYNGLPVVATRAGGIPELVEQGREGLLCPIGDAQCLSAKIDQLLNDADLRKRLGANARKRAENFTFDKMGEGVMAIYRKVAMEGEPA